MDSLRYIRRIPSKVSGIGQTRLWILKLWLWAEAIYAPATPKGNSENYARIKALSQ